MRRGKPASSLIFRSTHCPHAVCHNATGPVTTPITVTTPLSTKKATLGFGWHLFLPQNELSRELFLAAGARYLDVYWSSSLRPDGHGKVGDCAHYCLPGPVDDWNQMLLYLLSTAEPSHKRERHAA